MKNTFTTKKRLNTLLLLAVALAFLSYAFSTGITGVTLKNGNGCNCHGDFPSAGVNVAIIGPDTLLVNQTATFTVRITGGSLTRGGTNIAASAGTLASDGGDLQLIGDELTHTSPKAPSAGAVTFQFQYTAPSNTGNQILYANGNSVNFNSSPDGDNWNFASNKSLTVLQEIPVEMESFVSNISESKVTLFWTTATETNNAGFEIFRKQKGTAEWLKVGFVTGNGTTVERNSYSFIDPNLKSGIYGYMLRQKDYDGTFSDYQLQNEVEVVLPKSYSLSQNYPNPFNPSTKINFSLVESGTISIRVFNTIGEEITLLANGYYEAGSHSVNFNASQLYSGIYYYQLTASGNSGEEIFKATKKMILIK
jgi:hypothetical protein